MVIRRCVWCFTTYEADDGNQCPTCGYANNAREQALIAQVTDQTVSMIEYQTGHPLPQGVADAILRRTTFEVRRGR